MSIQVGCMICGESSPKTIDTGPAVEWSRAHRCSVPKLVELARERRTATRIGKSTARETDRDLVIMGELAKQLSEAEARVGVVAEEPEWEYGYRPTYAPTHPEHAGEPMPEICPTNRRPDDFLPGMGGAYRRTKKRVTPAGPWAPVKQEGAE